MNREEADEIMLAYNSKCESGELDWGWIDGADTPCWQYLFLNPGACEAEPEPGTSCFGLSYQVKEGDPLRDYVEFMTGAIENPDRVENAIAAQMAAFIESGDSSAQWKVAQMLRDDPALFGSLMGPPRDEFIRSLAAASAAQGNEEAAQFGSSIG